MPGRSLHLQLAGLADFGGLPPFATPDAEPRYAPDLGLEPVHLDIGLRLDLAGRTAEAQVTTTVACRTAGRRLLVLDAVGLVGLSVEPADGHALEWRYDGSQVHLTWAEAPARGEQRVLTARYRVEDPLTGMIFGGPTPEAPSRPLFVATDHETERARYWLPCVDHPSVRTTLAFHLRLPTGLTALANGALTGTEEHDDGTTTHHWRLDQRCPSYLACFVAGGLVRAEGGSVDGKEIAFFAPPPLTAGDLSRSFGRTAEMLAWMNEKLGVAYPFPKYFQFAVPGIGGAMENISLVSWDDAWVADPRLHAELGWLIDLVNLHEMSHSWFGDAVVCRDFAHAWLKESWATYMESVWCEREGGAEAMHYQLHLEKVQYTTEADERYVRPIVTRRFDSSWDMYDAHLYPGGAWRLHMLRNVVGDAAFWSATRDYLARYMGRVVETDDFRRIVEEHSGRSLGRFFDQWFASPGYPKLQATWEHDAEKAQGTFTVEQKQIDAEKGVPAFTFELEVALEMADGTWTRHVVSMEDARHRLVIPLAAPPRQVVVDPECKVLHTLEFDPGAPLLGRALTDCPWVTGRIQAAQGLARSGKRDASEKIRDAWGAEGHWGVRRAWAAALGSAGTVAAAQALAMVLLAERDPRVMVEITTACGKYREPEIAQALVAWLALPERPYRATAAALQSLGAQREGADLDVLTAHAADTGWWGWVRRGALQGLGATRTATATEALMGRVGPGESRQVRMLAAPALAEAARWQPTALRERARDVLSDLVRDPEYKVRLAAGSALADLGEPGAATALEDLQRSVAGQDKPAVRRLQARLSKASDRTATADLEEKVARLEDRLRKLAERQDR